MLGDLMSGRVNVAEKKSGLHRRVGVLAGVVVGASFLMMPSYATAAVLLVDFSTDVAGTGPGGTWNQFSSTTVSNRALVDSTSNTTSVLLTLSGKITDSSRTNFTGDTFDPNRANFIGTPTWATSSSDNSASGDFFYTAITETVQHTFTSTFSGLTAGDDFSLDLLASRNTGDAKGFYEYSLDNGANWSGFKVLNDSGTAATNNNWSTQDTKSQVYSNQTEGYQNHRYLNISDVTLTGTTLQVRVTDADALGPTFSVVNAMRLTVVPEPSLAGVAGLVAGVGLLRRRRARSLA